MRCPNCRGKNVIAQTRAFGPGPGTNQYGTGAQSSLFVQASRKGGSGYKSVMYCPNCGYTWELRRPPKALGCVLYLAVLVLVLSVLLRACAKVDKNPDATVEKPKKSTSVWATEYTPLEDFDYYIDKDQLYLREYNGRSKKVYIAPEYERNGKILKVVALDGAMFFGRVDSIIISEGIEEVNSAALNCSGVKYLYFPSTVTDFNGFTYIHDGETLYYGGTEEMWAELYPYERSRLEVVEVICNATVEDLLEQ